MWGNLRGWLISGVLVLLTVGLIFFVTIGNRPAPRTEWSDDPAHFAAITLPAPPPGILASQTDCDGGELYRQAIELFQNDRATYENFAQLGKLDSPQASHLPAIELLVQAAGCSRAVPFGNHPAQVVNVDHTKPPIEALRTLGQVCVDRLGLLNLRAGNATEARRFFVAGFALGQSLCRERLDYAELELGLELVSKSCAGLIRLAEQANHPDESTALREFDAHRVAYVRDHIDPVSRVVRSIDPNVVGIQTGDVFELANRSQDRMWRVEAIFALGRLRYFAGTGGSAGSQRAATKLVDKLANDPDPVIRAAAIAARNLTAEQHRMQ